MNKLNLPSPHLQAASAISMSKFSVYGKSLDFAQRRQKLICAVFMCGTKHWCVCKIKEKSPFRAAKLRAVLTAMLLAVRGRDPCHELPGVAT